MEMFYVTWRTFLTHSQPTAEIQNVGTTQFSISKVTHFHLEFKIADRPLRNCSTTHYLLKAGRN